MVFKKAQSKLSHLLCEISHESNNTVILTWPE